MGKQRAVQVARALCGRPRLLLLDEPASGLRAGEQTLVIMLGIMVWQARRHSLVADEDAA